MTRLTIVCMHLIVILMILVCPSSAKINQKSIVAVWLFDEGKGDTASDFSGNGHDGEIGNGIKWITGQYGSQALHLPGSAVVIVPHEASLNLLTWTITAWIKVEFKNG